jgi:hypothetical protein
VDEDDESYPASLSDFPGGMPPSQSEIESIEKMDVADLGAKFARMTPQQQEAYLNNLP